MLDMSTVHVTAVSGTVTIRERIAIPPGSVATVKLVDGDGEVLSATALDVEGVPAAFTLLVDPELVTKPSELTLWAALRTEAGLWGTTDLVPVGSDGTDVVLTRIEA